MGSTADTAYRPLASWKGACTSFHMIVWEALLLKRARILIITEGLHLTGRQKLHNLLRSSLTVRVLCSWRQRQRASRGRQRRQSWIEQRRDWPSTSIASRQGSTATACPR